MPGPKARRRAGRFTADDWRSPRECYAYIAAKSVELTANGTSDRVTRALLGGHSATEVMLVRVADQLSEIRQAWASFETKVGLRGRKFYGAFDPVSATYSVCAVLRPGDDPSEYGAENGTLPGGRCACVRLHGEPPSVYEQIGPTAERLAQRADVDHTRPTLEYYRRRALIEASLRNTRATEQPTVTYALAARRPTPKRGTRRDPSRDWHPLDHM